VRVSPPRPHDPGPEGNALVPKLCDTFADVLGGAFAGRFRQGHAAHLLEGKRPVQERLAGSGMLEAFSPISTPQTCPRSIAATPAVSSSGGTRSPPGRLPASPSELFVTPGA